MEILSRRHAVSIACTVLSSFGIAWAAGCASEVSDLETDSHSLVYQCWQGAGLRLNAGDRLEPCDGGSTQLVMQPDGNLVLYAPDGVLWSSETYGYPGAFAVFQGDGNFVIYAADGETPLWEAGTNRFHATSLYVVEGAVVIAANTDAQFIP